MRSLRPRALPLFLHAVLHAATLVLGAAVALTSVAVHRIQVLGLPAGLLLAAAASLLLAAVLRWTASRLATSYAAGWLLVGGGVALGRPEGDIAVVADTPGYALMGVALVLGVAGVTSLRARAPGRSRPPA